MIGFIQNKMNEKNNIIEYKICSKCKENKKITDFYWYNKKRKGVILKYMPMSNCKNCCKITNSLRKGKENYIENSKKYYKNQKNDFNKNEILKEKARNYHKNNLKKFIYQRAKKRAKLYNLDFNISENDIIIPEFCPLLNIPIVAGTKSNYENTPSLDRIDNNKGYTKENIWVISKKANSMKNSASIEELKIFCNNINLHFPN